MLSYPREFTCVSAVWSNNEFTILEFAPWADTAMRHNIPVCQACLQTHDQVCTQCLQGVCIQFIKNNSCARYLYKRDGGEEVDQYCCECAVERLNFIFETLRPHLGRDVILFTVDRFLLTMAKN